MEKIAESRQGNSCIYSWGPITVVSQNGPLPLNDGHRWIGFYEANNVLAWIDPVKQESFFKTVKVTERRYCSLAEIVPITGCTLEFVFKEIADKAFLTL